MHAMADEIDIANDRAEADTERAIAAARSGAEHIQPGQPGDCDFCGEWSGRLVNGACAPCRDRRRLP
jgi:hypothetical protein